MSRACLDCLARARLIESLAGRIARLADKTERPVRGLLALPDDELLHVTRVPAGDRRGYRKRARDAARDDRDRVIDGGAVCVHGDCYPEPLRELNDAPRALFHTGPIDRLLRLLDEKGAAVVGARKASNHGKNAAYELGRGLSAAGVTVISGMAFGIDAACHRGALAGGGRAIAVLASGADRSSPVSNRGLYRELRASGTIISEMPWGASPWPWLFPARNRIMAALAELTVVVEATPKSGSLITAKLAAEIDRTVGAMPGTPGAGLTAGNNELLYDGCAVIRDARDALEVLYGVSKAAELCERAVRGPAIGDPYLAGVLEAVEVGASFDELAERTGLSARDLRAALAKLERGGAIRRAGLGTYVPAAGATC
jgi:DNA processing protein